MGHILLLCQKTDKKMPPHFLMRRHFSAVLFSFSYRSQSEISRCVLVGDTLDDLLKRSLVVGILAVLYPLADQVAHDAAEVVMSCIGQEGSGVCQHTYEVAQTISA